MLKNFSLSYCEFRPPAELATHVACTWCNLSRAVVGAPAQAIIPDGCADIIVFGDEAPHIAAPARTTQWVNPPPVGTLISGIRFRPGAVRRILGCDAIELPDWSVELEAVCGRRSWPLLAELRAAGRSDARRRAALAGWARHQLDQNTEADHLVLRAGAMLTRAAADVAAPYCHAAARTRPCPPRLRGGLCGPIAHDAGISRHHWFNAWPLSVGV
ncbi:DUF6597 domain-containing transcriptional factor [Rhizobium laguerreae]|uniref:DUF6597 domain-containing protein n=1 Tax=Rhizobium laguerreae TaxID=1076926 RepID=A0AAX2QA47_9HYPH|nr:hypothetical protein EV131_1315 [Rhizobium laguerreae]